MKAKSTEASPRIPEALAGLPHNDAIVEAARERGVTDVLHFTHTQNLIGILATAVKSRALVQADSYVELVHDPNCADRWRDREWTGYVSLSISRINDWMLGCSRRWHRNDDVEWVILSFEPEILGHPGVVFTTTNNAYPTCLRAEGMFGFGRVFADEVESYNRTITRGDLDDRYPTDRWAEALYPGALSLDHLQRIYVDDEEMTEHIGGILSGVARDCPTEFKPEVFR